MFAILSARPLFRSYLSFGGRLYLLAWTKKACVVGFADSERRATPCLGQSDIVFAVAGTITKRRNNTFYLKEHEK